MSGEQNPHLIISFCSFVNLCLGRFVGAVPLSIDLQTLTASKSKFWQFSSVLIAGTFIFCYPIVIRDIFAERRLKTSGSWLITEIIQYTSTYLLTAYIYFVNLFYLDEIIGYINGGFHYSYRYEHRLLPTADEWNALLLQFVFRGFYSYFGFVFSNYIRLTYIYDRSTDIRTIIYYLPDIVITSTAIRFMTTIMIQLTFTRRLNEIARVNMQRANTTSGRTRYEREKIACEISDQIDWLCDHHCRMQNIARATERLLSKILILSTVYAFANLVSCVNALTAIDPFRSNNS